MKELTIKNVIIVFTDRGDLNQTLSVNRKINFPLFIPNQKHTSKVISLDEDITQEADGIYLDKTGVAVGVLTADCMPIVLFNDRELSVIHAGWRGLFGGIIENSIKMFKEKPTNCFIGPSIRVCCYEVSPDFIYRFNIDEKFYIKREDRYFLSLQNIAKEKLKNLGIDDIFDLSECTACCGKYFSFRKGDFDDRILTYAYLRE
ncbi:MAG: polyphenol oxidase family protein [Hydrogenothermaceae bacterium]|nr:polyphenol oxidase family protein [Hydrogenothermaceae bacterium]